MSWTEKSNRLTKTYHLNSFDEIILQLVLVAKIADDLGHHPDFAVENYDQITFFLWTHNEGKVTPKDHELAKELDAIFEAN